MKVKHATKFASNGINAYLHLLEVQGDRVPPSAIHDCCVELLMTQVRYSLENLSLACQRWPIKQHQLNYNAKVRLYYNSQLNYTINMQLVRSVDSFQVIHSTWQTTMGVPMKMSCPCTLIKSVNDHRIYTYMYMNLMNIILLWGNNRDIIILLYAATDSRSCNLYMLLQY